MGLINMNDGSTIFIRNMRDAMDVVRDKVSYELGNYLEEFLEGFPLETNAVAIEIEDSMNSIMKAIKEQSPGLDVAIDHDVGNINMNIRELKDQYELMPEWF